MASTNKTVQEFTNSLRNLPLVEKHKEWIRQLTILEDSKDLHLDSFYKEYLEFFPFNFTYWNKCAQNVAATAGKEEALKIYQKAVEMNPRSIDLWNCYCSWVAHTFSAQNDLVASVYEKAVEQIGYDFNSYIIWDAYLNFEIPRNVEKSHLLFLSVNKLPIGKLESYVNRFKEFLSGLSELDIMNIYHKNYSKSENDVQDLKGTMIQIFESENKKTLVECKDRKLYENQLKKTEFDDSSSTEYGVWSEYIEHEKQFKKKDRTTFIYEKALITQSTNIELWFEYFEFLEESLDISTLSGLFLKYKDFFKHLDINILYYWADFLETQDIEKARSYYQELQKDKSFLLQTSLRLCQLEVRVKNFLGAKIIYEQLLTSFKDQPQLVTFVLIEYSDFSRAYFNDISQLKNTYQSIFEKLPYSKYFISAYLKFLKEVLNETSKEFLVFISTLCEKILKKCSETSKTELPECLKIITSFVRSSSIDLSEIRGLEKKFKNIIKNYKKTKENSLDDEKSHETLLKKRALNEIENLGKELSENAEKIAKQAKIEN